MEEGSIIYEFDLPLLRKAVEWAEAEAARPWNESEWYQEFIRVSGAEIRRTCETAYCIAGYAAFISGELDQDDTYESGTGERLLGLTQAEAWYGFRGSDHNWRHGLFAADNTIEQVRDIAEEIAKRHGEKL